MSIFKSLFKKRKKPSSPPEAGEDVLNTNLAKSTTDPEKCTVTKSSIFGLEKNQLETINLLKGASDSKPVPKTAKNNEQQRRPTSSTSKDPWDLAVMNKDKVSAQYLQSAQTSQVSTSKKLYPNLNSVNNETEKSQIEERAIVKKQKMKSIHDVAKEIQCTINPKIYCINSTKALLDDKKSAALRDILAVKNILRGLNIFDYDFNKELYVREKHSDIENYKTLHSFREVEEYHKDVLNRIQFNEPNNVNRVSAFQSYRTSLRCYRGRKDDKISCS